MSRVWVLQHTPCETAGTIRRALAAQKLTAATVRTFAGAAVPGEMGDAVALIVMGGPMGAYEAPRYPFLTAELRLIEDALKREKPILGVCLGSQLLATALGARVVKGKQKEIGWHPVTLTPEASAAPAWNQMPHRFTPLHWHGDIFDLPASALRLASSALTQNQAFRYGRGAYGLLFHMEVTEPIVRGMVEAFPDELREAGVRSSDILIALAQRVAALNAPAELIFGSWAQKIEEKSA